MLLLALPALAAATAAPICKPDGASAPPPPSSSLWHGDCGPECCQSFCNGECVFPGPVGSPLAGVRQNITVTRLTPWEVDDPLNKDFGDLGGDLDFALMQKRMTQQCRRPGADRDYMCYNGTGKWLKPGSRDQVFMQWVLEVNGAFGPYSKCNPDVHTGEFVCGVWDWNASTRIVQPATVCGNCSRVWQTVGWESRNKSYGSHVRHCKPGPSPAPSPQCRGGVCPGMSDCNHTKCPCPPPPPPPADLGGNWFSTTAQSQCKQGERPGEGTGCAWRTTTPPLIRNATCVMGHIAAAAIGSHLTSGCFAGCPDGTADPVTHHNTSLCWDDCMQRFRAKATAATLLGAFAKGFEAQAEGGCPQLPPYPRRRQRSTTLATVVYDDDTEAEMETETPSTLSTVSVDWNTVLARTHATPTVHSPNSYAWQRTDPHSGATNPLHDILYTRLKELGTDHIRYMQAQDTNGLNNLSAYPEPYPPDHTSRTTSWSHLLSGIDPFVVDFCAATKFGDCSDTIIFIGPLPPWLFYTSPKNRTVCTAADSRSCVGALIDPSGRTAGEYFSRIISWFTKGGFTDEFGVRHVSNHHFNFTLWEVLNEPNGFAHFYQEGGFIQTYTRVYDGITAVLHRDHPELQFVAMCYSGVPSLPMLQYFLNESHHTAAALQANWPPAFLTFHIYESCSSSMLCTPGIKEPALSEAQEAAKFIVTATGGSTKPAVDEMGNFGPGIDYDTTLDGGPNRFAFWNPRAAWFAAAYGQLASAGVEQMGASQFFGFPSDVGRARRWHAGGQGQDHGLNGSFWYYPFLSALNWDTGTPNPRYHVIKLLVETLAGSELKHVAPAIVRQPPLPPLPAPPPVPPRGVCKQTHSYPEGDFVGGDICEYNIPSAHGPALLAECAAACCADPKCQNFVTTPSGNWKGAGPCAGKPKCPGSHGSCCYLKDASSVSVFRNSTHYAAGSVTPSNYRPSPGGPKPPHNNTLLAFGFVVGGKKRLLLVNTGGYAANNVSVVPGGVVGAMHSFVDEHHGHGDVAYGHETLASRDGLGTFDVDAYGVSVLSWP